LNGGRPSCCFIHGYSDHPDHWEKLHAALSKVFRGDTPALAGHGGCTEASGPFTIERCANDILTGLQEPSILVGHSMGTRIAMEIARCAPEMVLALVLVDGSNAPGDSGKLARTRQAENQAGDHDHVMDDILESMLVDDLPKGMLANMAKRIYAMPDAVALGYEISMMDWDTHVFPEALLAIACPVLVLQSTSLVPGKGWERRPIEAQPNSLWLDAWQASGKADIRCITGAGHYVMMEKPQVVAREMRALLARISTS